MKTITIEKGISPPERNRGPLSIYPLDKMEIEDSFKLEPNENETMKSLTGRLYAAISYYRKHIDSDKKFTCRVTGDIIRCWRLK